MAEVWARLGLGEFSASGLHSKPRACRVPTPHGCTTHIKVSTSDVPWSRAVLSLPECTQQPWIFLELQVSQTDTGRERENLLAGCPGVGSQSSSLQIVLFSIQDPPVASPSTGTTRQPKQHWSPACPRGEEGTKQAQGILSGETHSRGAFQENAQPVSPHSGPKAQVAVDRRIRKAGAIP